jgi:hypothetical protein
MKSILLLTIIFSFNSYGSFYKSSGNTTREPVIKKRKFFRVLSHMQKTFQYLGSNRNEELVVMGGWIDPNADMAFARRWDTAQVLIYRGMAHRRELDEDSLMLIICHELGHLYGGPPFSNESNEISLEGQSDYFATKSCLTKALKTYKDKNVEVRTKLAMQNVAKFLANNWSVPYPRFDTPDQTIVDEMIKTHPNPQCRLDTFVAGLELLERPYCWYANN